MFALKALMTRARLGEHRCAPSRFAAASEIRPRQLSVQFDHRRHRPGRRHHADRHQSAPRGARCSTPASASASVKGNLLLGLVGEKADLTYPYNYLGAGPESLAQFVDHAPAQKGKADVHHRAGRAQRVPTAPPCWRWRRRPRLRSASSRTAGTASTVLHSEASRVGALDIGFVPGEGGLDTRAMLKAGALDVLFLLGVDEVEVAGGRLRRLYRHARRPRRASRRRHPAGRRLSGKIRPLRQHRRPRADGEPRRLPARRRARGLGDLARAVRCARRKAAVRFARRLAARACSRRIRI